MKRCTFLGSQSKIHALIDRINQREGESTFDHKKKVVKQALRLVKLMLSLKE